MNFTFCICTYNQESLILETLESIKYQIENYGKSLNFSIVISDDHSSDDTVEICKYWLEINKNIFKKTIVIESKINQGTVANFIKCISSVESDLFKLIAGDDLFSYRNLFEVIPFIKDNDLVGTLNMGFRNYKMEVSLSNFERPFYYMMKSNVKLYRKDIKKRIIFGGPSTFFKKDMLTQTCIDYLAQFKYIEDHTSWVKFFEEKEDIKCSFVKETYVLHRESNTSVQYSSKFRKPVYKDRAKLDRYLLSKEKNVFTKLYLRLSLISLKTNKVYLKPIIYINMIPRLILSIRVRLTFYNNGFKNHVKREMDLNQQHIESIRDKSKLSLITINNLKNGKSRINNV